MYKPPPTWIRNYALIYNTYMQEYSRKVLQLFSQSRIFVEFFNEFLHIKNYRLIIDLLTFKYFSLIECKKSNSSIKVKLI